MARWEGPLYGWAVRSEIELGWHPPVPSDSAWWEGLRSLTLRQGASRIVPDARPDGEVISEVYDGVRYYTAVASDDGYQLRLYGLADLYMNADLSEIVVHSDRYATPEYVAPHLVGTVLAFVLGMAGTCVLHASAFGLPGPATPRAAIAVLGESGRGKSTLTTLACAAGAHFISDDTLSFDMTGAVPLVHKGHTETRLREPVDQVLAQFNVTPPTRSTVDGRVAVGLASPGISPVALEAGLLPLRVDALLAPRLRRLPPYAAFKALTVSARLPGARRADQLALHFSSVEAIARAVPVFELQLPGDHLPTVDTLTAVFHLLDEELHAPERDGTVLAV